MSHYIFFGLDRLLSNKETASAFGTEIWRYRPRTFGVMVGALFGLWYGWLFGLPIGGLVGLSVFRDLLGVGGIPGWLIALLIGVACAITAIAIIGSVIGGLMAQSQTRPSIGQYIGPSPASRGIGLSRLDGAARRSSWFISFLGWILRFGISAGALVLIPRPTPSIYSTGTEDAAWLLLQVLIFIGGAAPQRWLVSTLLTRTSGLRGALVILRLAWKIKVGVYTMVASVGALAVVTYYVVFGVELFPYSVLTVLTLVIVNILVRLQPPVALVLTGSERVLLVEDICQMVRPHRVVALLDNRSIGITMRFSKIADNLRTLPLADWRDTVRRLADVAPLVIVDTNVPRDSLKFETGLMLESSRVTKTLFVVGVHGESPALDAQQREPTSDRQIRKVTIEKLPEVLHQLGIASVVGRISTSA